MSTCLRIAGSWSLPWLLALEMVALCLCLFPALASASGEYEPNDDITQATQMSPMTYKATLETAQDEDWYWVPLGGQQQITFSAAFTGGECWALPDAEATLRDGLGREVTTLDAILQEEGEGQEYHYTTPPASQAFFIQVKGGGATGVPCEYEVSITPASAYTPASQSPVVPVLEPDNVPAQAHGPIMGEVLYAGTIDYENDIDQLYFDSKPDQHIAVELPAFGCGWGDALMAKLTQDGYGLLPAEGLESIESGERGGETFDSRSGGRVYIAVSGGVGCHWQLWASPASALLTSVPTVQHANPCKAARRSLKRRIRHLHRLEKKLRRAHVRAVRGKIHHKVEARKRGVRAARHTVRVHCPQSGQ